MRQEKLNRMRDLAQRIVERSCVEETRFSEYSPDWPRFGSWLPIAKEIYQQEDAREMLSKRAQELWRIHAFHHILRPSMLIGPKGNLPA